MVITSRRSFLRGLLATPAVVAASSLMPVTAKLLIPRVDVAWGYTVIRPEWLVLDEFSERVLTPMMNRLQEQVAETLLYGQSANHMFVDNDVLCVAPGEIF